MMAPIELVLGKIITTAIADVNYHFGDEQELIKFLNFKEKAASHRIAFGDISTVKKYPLVWMEVGARRPLKERANFNTDNELIYRNVRLIIACNTNRDWMNKARWKDNLIKLETIEEQVRVTIEKSKHLDILNNNWESYKETNTSLIEEFATYDFWDAILIDCSLRLYTSCLEEIDYLNC